MSFRKMGLSVLLLTVCVFASDLMAQPGGGRGGRGGFGGGFGGGGMLGLLQNSSVQEKLDLTDGQIAEIKELSDDMRAKMQEMMQERNFEGMREMMTEISDEAKDVLLEKQVKMLDKIQNQQRYMRGGTLRVSKEFFVDVLEMDEGDAEDAMKTYEDLQKKFAAKVSKELQAMIKDMAKELPKEAGKKFEEMFGGEIIQIAPPQRQQGGRGAQGGRGGRGGAQGGGRGGRGGGNDF